MLRGNAILHIIAEKLPVETGSGVFDVAFDEIIPRDERDRIFEELLVPFLGTLDLIASGVGDE